MSRKSKWDVFETRCRCVKLSHLGPYRYGVSYLTTLRKFRLSRILLYCSKLYVKQLLHECYPGEVSRMRLIFSIPLIIICIYSCFDCYSYTLAQSVY